MNKIRKIFFMFGNAAWQPKKLEFKRVFCSERTSRKFFANGEIEIFAIKFLMKWISLMHLFRVSRQLRTFYGIYAQHQFECDNKQFERDFAELIDKKHQWTWKYNRVFQMSSWQSWRIFVIQVFLTFSSGG